MRTNRIIITVISFIFLTVSVNAQFYRSVTGNGNVVTKERTAPYFDGIRVSTGIDVYLSQGERESIRVEADENLHEYIVTEVKGGILNVYFDNVSIRSAKTKKVYVTMKNIRSLKTSSAGDIIGETPIRCEYISLSSSSAGDITLELYAKYVDIEISSSGNIKLSGEAETLNASLSSAGDLNAFDFKVKEANINVSSAGDAEIYVTEKLVAKVSSAGDVVYDGNPKYIDARSSSAGRIRKR
ncbi:MAG TPA: head GIN domain-containing protein [Bacteroidales bacterium]|nr:hypothetical protein [Bacteroidales bacterium]HRC88827.1 head GIN domain-containing protein [Bacteroidales bacterium]